MSIRFLSAKISPPWKRARSEEKQYKISRNPAKLTIFFGGGGGNAILWTNGFVDIWAFLKWTSDPDTFETLLNCLIVGHSPSFNCIGFCQKNPRAHQNPHFLPPMPKPKIPPPPPPKTRNFMGMAIFPAEKTQFFQAPINLA